MTNWKHTIDLKDIYHDPDLGETEFKNAVVTRLAESELVPPHLMDSMRVAAATGDEEDWELTYNAVYDWADAEKVWIATMF